MTGQKTLYQRHGCIVYDKWITTSRIIKSDLAAEKAFSGRHYNSGIRILKESFDVQMISEDLTDGYQNIVPRFLESLTITIRNDLNEGNVERTLIMPEFSKLMKEITDISGKQ